ALLGGGGDDGHLAQFSQCVGHRRQTGGMNTVIVRQKDMHEGELEGQKSRVVRSKGRSATVRWSDGAASLIARRPIGRRRASACVGLGKVVSFAPALRV